jgi:hypothetical protein
MGEHDQTAEPRPETVPEEDVRHGERGGPGRVDQTGAGSGELSTTGLPETEDDAATDRGAGKDGPTPNPAQIAP